VLVNFTAGAGAGSVPAARAYLLAVRAELSERGNDLNRALADYGAALLLAPGDDSIRAALADAMAASGRTQEACNLLDIEKPSLALLVRRVRLAQGTLHKQLYARATSWLELEAARGDSPHAREAALLALDGGDPARALRAALTNFTLQKELPDVRVLARAAISAGDSDARRQLHDWLRLSGYRDAVTETILAGAPRG
jgi:Flp pilus assembly protein TadD